MPRELGNKNKKMNIKSKFSWGHIIAFVALILISYGTFMGAAYSANGKLLNAGLWVVGIDLLLLFFMLVPQMLKGVSKKDAVRTRPIEKTLLYISPIVFVVLIMMPFSPFTHFTNVLQHKSSIENNFSTAIKEADFMFDSYAEYSKQRIDSHDLLLTDSASSLLQSEIASRQSALDLLLLPPSYEQLHAESQKWIEHSCMGATIWNVFTVGNISEIQEAVTGWHNYLLECSRKQLSSEDDPATFDADGAIMQSCQQKFNEIKGLFAQRSFSLIAILLGLLLYGMLLLPYLLQERDSGLFANNVVTNTNDDFIF